MWIKFVIWLRKPIDNWFAYGINGFSLSFVIIYSIILGRNPSSVLFQYSRILRRYNDDGWRQYILSGNLVEEAVIKFILSLVISSRFALRNSPLLFYTVESIHNFEAFN